ncbi:conserved hypothetical protein [Methanococcus aeolicus Nankai-3]|uniref:DegT/DnrJ/EryC1/StrS aminotransferase n=1 Tax=Methanococcus aeolicus (strain ATCC BAA-1280 / DSM 17508 / OCM 812 / Nankai-3) TaxID=419665 RepID=A6UUV8_META3|nr:hypothetical protein [Methanococcus aeolicus]ABR56280.1 conserved hypothetical protein [Methanococcus aeolicus Nankai-3]
MIIPHRKPCIESQLNKEGNINELNNVLNDLLQYDKELHILPSGNASIFIASKIIYDLNNCCNILVPDMGGWKGFINYPKSFNHNVLKLTTNDGIVDINVLDETIKKNNIKALFLTSLAGYLAVQPLKEIKKICSENNVIFVEDISGGVGGNCGYGDIIVCSTGAPKIINCEYGGFMGISGDIKQQLKENNKLENLKHLLKTYKVPNIHGSIKEEALRARETYKKCVVFSNIIKEEFENSYYKDNEGVGVFIEHNNPNEIVKKINNIIKLDDGKSILTKCPLYERILKKGFVLELKKIDIRYITKNNIDEIMYIIKTSLGTVN